jgi:hypothetical protein
MSFLIAGALALNALSSSQAGRAAGRAGDIQAAAAREGIAEQRRQFDITQQQFEPFRQAGLGALSQQQAMLGLSGQEAQQQAFAGLQESPAQQFLRSRAERGLLRNQAAIGGLGGGNIRTALQQQGVGFAQQDIQNQFNRLGALTGGGQAATQNVAQLGGQTAQNIAGLQGQAGAAQASGILGAQQARGQFMGQLGSAALGAGIGAQIPGVGAGRGAMLSLLG